MADFFQNSKFVTELQPADFDDVNTWRLKMTGVESPNGECTAVLFYCHWCGYCQAVKEEWEKLGRQAAFCKVAAFHCARHKEHTEKIKYDMPQLITGYPTIVIYKNGDVVESYQGERTVGAMMKACMRVCSSK